MQFAASPVATKVYVGEGGSETAFVQHVRSLVAHAAPSAASTAASSIVRAVLLASQTSAAAQTSAEKTRTAPLPQPATTSQATTTTAATATAFSSSSAVSVLPGSLARRGVGPKDVLQQRLEKKRRRQQQQQQQEMKAEAGTPLSLQSHWSRRPLSAMNAASWAVFREQVGIELEVVNRRPGAGASEDKSRAARYTIDMVHPIRCWEEAGLPYSLGRSVAWHYAMPTAIQAACVPLANAVRIDDSSSLASASNSEGEMGSGRKIDCLAVAETGSGKTAAYVIPMLSDILCNRPKLLGDLERMALGPYGLVLVPTRELAEQVTREVHSLLRQLPQGGEARTSAGTSSHDTQLREWQAEELAALSSSSSSSDAYCATHNLLSELRVVKVVGGESSQAQYETLARGVHIVVGTIGQLRALLEERLLSLGNVAMCVIDEADRMLDEHQEDSLVAVLERCPRPRQTLLFTATLSAACVGLARRYLSAQGYLVVRCPHRCAAVTQCFELVAAEVSEAIVGSGAAENDDGSQANDAAAASRHGQRGRGAQQARGRRHAGADNMEQARSRVLQHTIHPDKFNRLVTWLAYATPPIVVFANEKRTCDALQEELGKERDHLARLEETFTLDALLGAAPAALASQAHITNNTTTITGSNSNNSNSPVVRLQNLRSVAVVHADQSQAERTRQVQAVHRGERSVLLTTDLLARGLDIANVTLVVNYDAPWPAPHEAADEAIVRYVHRIGRTGRAGRTGVAVTFLTLPSRLLRRMMSATSASSAAAAAGGGALTRLYTSERVREREAELRELTGKADNDDDDDANDDEGEDDEEEDDSNAEDDTEHVNGTKHDRAHEGQRRVRVRQDTSTTTSGGNNGAKPSCKNFASDEAILRPLWDFLCRCAEANGCKDGALALQRGSYAKIQLPAELAELMRRLATRSSQFGAIVN